jgi:peroxiredoxin
MSSKRAWLAGLLCLALAAVAAGRWLAAGISPEVEFVSLKGERVRLGDLRGHPVLVSFWATDCKACVEELPDLAALHRDYSERGFKLIAVAMQWDPPSWVVRMTRDAELPYTVALDPLGEIAGAFGEVRLVPNSFLIGPDGRVIRHRLGRISAPELRALIESLL